MALFRTGMGGINTPLENIVMFAGFIALIAGFLIHGAVMGFGLLQMIIIMIAGNPYDDYARRALYATPCLYFLALYLV